MVSVIQFIKIPGIYLLAVFFFSSSVSAEERRERRKAEPQSTQAATEPAEPTGVAEQEALDQELMRDLPSASKIDYKSLLESANNNAEEQIEIYYHHCSHIASDELKRILESFITPAGSLAASQESELVVVSDVKSNIEKLKTIARESDQQVPQILVQAQIVELRLDNDFEKEVNLAYSVVSDKNQSFIQNIMTQIATPGSSAQSLYKPLSPTTTNNLGQGGYFNVRPYTHSNHDGTETETLSTFLRYLETRGKAKLLSSPNLVLRRGIEGSIITGEDLPISKTTATTGSTSQGIEYKRVGVKLRVKPIKIVDDTVHLLVNPDVSAVTRYDTVNNAATPVIAVRTATTELEVKDGELISIGGLLRTEETDTERRVPVMSSIPGLGQFFRASRKTSVKSQLVIFLTIKILPGGKSGGVMIHRPDSIPEQVQEEIKRLDEQYAFPRTSVKSDAKMSANPSGHPAVDPTPTTKTEAATDDKADTGSNPAPAAPTAAEPAQPIQPAAPAETQTPDQPKVGQAPAKGDVTVIPGLESLLDLPEQEAKSKMNHPQTEENAKLARTSSEASVAAGMTP